VHFNLDSITSIFSALVIVALVTTVVAHPGSAEDIRAFGDAFSSSTRAALGN
jgi:hypothetical protein